MTACEVKFSDAMSSRPLNCRAFSLSMISATSGSSSARGIGEEGRPLLHA